MCRVYCLYNKMADSLKELGDGKLEALLEVQFQKYMGKFIAWIAELERCITEKDTVIEMLGIEVTNIKSESGSE